VDTVVTVSFHEGKRVDAHIDGQVIRTDQSVANGGAGLAPEPFSLFLASIASCAGFYAMQFCQARTIDTQGLGLSMHCVWDDQSRRYARITFALQLPAGFPQKYHKALQRAVDACMVKKHILTPPEFEVVLSAADPVEASLPVAAGEAQPADVVR